MKAKMKRFLSLMLAILLVFGSVPMDTYAAAMDGSQIITDDNSDTENKAVECTKEENCQAIEHIEGCSKYEAPEIVCEAAENCEAKTHIEECSKYVIPCTYDEDCLAKVHVDGCPADVEYLPCPTEGCEMTKGHPDECTGAALYIENSVAKVGENYYETLSEAFKAVTSDNDTVTLLNDYEGELTGAYLRGNIVTENGKKVTITLTNTDWVSMPYTFVIGEGITLNIPDGGMFYYAGGSVIKGKVVTAAYYQRYAGTKLTIEEPGSLTVTSETFIVRYMDEDSNAGIYIVGDNNDNTVGLDAAVIYFYQGCINAKNADIKVGTYWQRNTTDGQGSANLVLDNSNMTVTVNEHNMEATGTSTVTLTNGSSVAVAGGYEGVNVSADASSSFVTKNGSMFVAEVANKQYKTLQDAVGAANAGDTVTILKNIKDVAVTVDKNLTIKGATTLTRTATPAVTAENVTINAVEGCGELKVENLSFTGNSWINSGAASKLTVSGVTADVTPSNAAQTNSRSAFISLGRSEQHELELVVENCNIVSKGGSDCILGWAAIKNATLTGNTFGSADAHQSNSDSVKFMSIANGAEFNITGNTVYSDYNGIVFAQNTTRENAYKANINANTFVGNADHIWVEITGGDTVHATIKATSANTVNGNAFTVEDIKVHTRVIKNWTSYAGVDVQTDENGKVIGGTLAYYAEDALAEGFEIDENKEVVKKPVVAKIGEAEYATLEEAFAAAAEGNTITLLADATPVLKSQRAITKAAVIDLGGKTLTLTEDDLYFGTTTFKNGTIVVDPSVISSTAVFWMFANQTLTFDNVKLVATGVTGTYLIGLDGNNSDLNLLNGSEIYVNNTTALDLDIICVNASTGNDIVINNSKVNVTNLDGRVFFRGNYTVSGNSDIDLAGITKAGFRIEAGQTLSIEDTATVDIVGELRDGGIHLTDATATYTKAETATVNASIIKPVAEVAGKIYADLHDAMVAAKSGETVKLLSDVNLAGTEWEPVSFNGKFDGQDHVISNLTINKPGVSNTGFITSLNGEFKNVTFTNPTVTGGECTGVVAGRAGGSAALAENITVNGTIKVETTHSGYARAGVIVGGWAYGNYVNITVDGGNKELSYIKHTGGGDGRYVAGIVGHADDVTSYKNCTVKNITISGGWLCGGIAGPGPANAVASGCSVDNIDMHADYSGGMFGWYSGNGTIKDSSIKNVTFTDGSTNNGIIGGYSNNTNAKVENVTSENVINKDNKPLLDHEARINDKNYCSLAEAVAAAQNGDTIEILKAGTYAVPSGKDITITGAAADVVFDNIGAHAMGGADVTFNNVTFNYAKDSAYKGLQHSGNLTYNDCTFNGQVFLYGTSETFNNCTFNQTDANNYNVWTYSAKEVSFNECTFNSAGRSVLIYADGGDASNVSVTNSAFNASAPAEGKAAIEMDSSNNAGINITIDGATTATGFGTGNVSGNSLWNNKKGNKDANNDITVVVNGVTVLKPIIIEGTGTVEDPFVIDELDELKLFRDNVNSGTSYAGKYVKLAADINLGSEEWTPIGNSTNSFQGTFDGADHTISNLVVTGNKSNVGFFGFTTEGEVKNLTINNADVSGRLNVGAVAGTPYTTKYTNITLTGHVEVKGMAYVGGVGGKNAYADWTDITVNVDPTSFVKAKSTENGAAYRTYVGGVIGFMGEGGHTFKNITSNINVIGDVCDVGGITGIAHYGNRFENVTCSGNVTNTNPIEEEAAETGGIAGTWHNQVGETVTLNDCTYTGKITAAGVAENAITGAAYAASNVLPGNSGSLVIDDVVVWPVVAKVGDKEYGDLQTAINEANGITVTVQCDLTLKETLTISKDTAVTLDLNGKTITGKPAEAKAYEVIKNNGTLTITGTGTVACDYTLEGSTGYAVNTITNCGTLTIDDVTIKNTSEKSGQIGYAIDNNSTTTDVMVVIKAGEVVASGSNYYDGIRQFSNSEKFENTVAVEGGEVSSIWMQNPSGNDAKDVKGSVSISGGKVNALYLEPSNGYKASITDGYTDKISYFTTSEGRDLKGFISGGTFGMDVTEWCALGYVVKENNGVFGIIADNNSLHIRNIEELKAFRNSVNEGNTYKGKTVYLANDIDLNNEEWTPIGNSTNSFQGTFDGQNHTVSNLKINNAALDCAGLFGYVKGATVKNVKINNVDIYAYSHVAPIVGHAYTGNIENCHVTGKINLVAQYAYAAGITADGYVNVRNCSVIADGTGVIKVIEKTGAGGITGWRGEGNLAIENCTVKNLEITAWTSLGGITGIAQYDNIITGCTVNNVKLTKTRENGQAAIGLAAGNWTAKADDNYTITITNNSFNNMSINGIAMNSLNQLYGSNYSYYDKEIKLVEEGNTDGNIETNFEVVVLNASDLQKALAYVKNGEKIKLGADVDVTETLNVKGKAVTLDLNGKTITGTDNNTSGNFYLINNTGKLTVKDSSTEKTGTITLTANNNSGWGRSSVVVANNPGGKLTVESGTIEHLGGTDMAYAIDNLTNGKGTYAETVIEGGTIKSTYRAIRQFLNGVEAQNILTVNGGTIEGRNKAIWMQDPSKNANTGKLTVGANANLIGDAYLSVTEGSTEWPVEVSIAAEALTASGAKVTSSNVPAGYEIAEVNGTYGVKSGVAKIGNEYYETFEEAVTHIATDGSNTTIKLLKDIEVGANIEFNYGSGDIIFTADTPVTVKQTAAGKDLAFTIGNQNNIVIDENVTFEVYDNASGMYVYYGPSITLNGTIKGGQNWGVLYLYNGKHTVSETGKIGVGRTQVGFADVTVQGEVDINYLFVERATFTAKGAKVDADVIYDNNNGGQRWGASEFNFINGTEVKTNKMTLSYEDSVLTIDMLSKLNASKILGKGKIVIDAAEYEAGQAAPISGDASGFKGTLEVINNDRVTATIDENGNVVLLQSLAGEGTEANPFLISSVEDLIIFRDSVNAGETKYNADGVYVALGADIDLADIDWSVNIGDDCNATFDGIFDGKGHTISNLTSTETAAKSDGYICTGLFGAIYGTAVVKNFTINNVAINTGDFEGNNVGAVVGYAYQGFTGTIENVKVTGNISINASKAASVGAIVGYAHAGSITIKDCAVVGDDNSVINGKSQIGGIVGYAGGKATIESCEVQNLEISGTGLVGGVTGILCGGTAKDNTVSNVDLIATGENWKNSAAIVAGTIDTPTIVSGTEYNNVTVNGEGTDALVGSEYVNKPSSPVGKVEAAIGNVYYTKAQNALKAANTGDIVTLLSDATLTEVVELNNFSLNIKGNYKLTLNDKLKVGGESTINISCNLSDEVWLEDGAIIKDSTINGDVFVAGNVTFRGDNSVNMIYDYGTLTDYYGTAAPMKWTVEEGATLKINKEARYGLGYGDIVTIKGSIEDALTARETLTVEDMTFFTHGLVAQESKGWNQNSSLTVEDAYVGIGSNNSFGNKPGNYGGEYTFNFENVVLDSSRITFYEALSKTEFKFTNSDVKTGTFMTNDEDSVFNFVNTKLVSTTTTNGNDEGNYHAGKMKLKNSSITYSAPLRNNGVITLDTTSSITAPSITGSGTFVIDAADYVAGQAAPIIGDASGFTGTLEVVNNESLEAVIKDRKVVLIQKLAGKGTEENPFLISSVEELIIFRDSVNAGETKYNADGVYVALGADIDLAGIDWSVNIGDDCNATFDGIFDGKGYTISNLTSTETAAKSDGYICTGLFGAIYGNAVIKNLTIKNVSIDTGNLVGNNVASVVGFAYNCKGSIENVKVVGNISINAENATGVGAILGYDYYGTLTIENCVVDGNSGSAIKGKSYVGGIVGYGSNGIEVTDVEVENIAIAATGAVGAVAGITLEGAKLTECEVNNVAMKVTGDMWQNSAAIVVGTITGATTVSDVRYKNVTVNGTSTSAFVGSELVEKPTSPVGKVQATIGNVYYPTIQKAVDAAKAGETVTVIDSIEITNTITVPAGKTVTLDLNGKTITGTPTEAKAYAVIENKGNLTITGNGFIVCDYTLTGSTGYAVNTITNCGTLTIDGVTVENKSTASNQIGYAIDNNSTLANASVVITSGEVKASGSDYYDGIRQFCNSLTNENSVTVIGGTVSSIWMQNPSDGGGVFNTKDVKGEVKISGGNVRALWLEPSTAFTAAITGGHTEKVGHNQTAENRDLTRFISGGTFGEAVAIEHCADGFIPVANADGTYGVEEGKFVAYIEKQDETYVFYSTVEAALSAAKSGETVCMGVNANAGTLVVPANITLDLNGKYLKLDNLLSFGNIIDTTDVVNNEEQFGGVVISSDTTKAFTILQPGNTYIPIYDTTYKMDDTEGCYRFFAGSVKNCGIRKNDATSVKLGFRPEFEKVKAYEVLANTDNAEMNIVVTLTWEGGSFGYTYMEKTLKDYGATALKHLEEKGEITAAMAVTITGLNKVAMEGTMVFKSSGKIVSSTSVVSAESDVTSYVYEQTR